MSTKKLYTIFFTEERTDGGKNLIKVYFYGPESRVTEAQISKYQISKTKYLVMTLFFARLGFYWGYLQNNKS